MSTNADATATITPAAAATTTITTTTAATIPATLYPSSVSLVSKIHPPSSAPFGLPSPIPTTPTTENPLFGPLTAKEKAMEKAIFVAAAAAPPAAPPAIPPAEQQEEEYQDALELIGEEDTKILIQVAEEVEAATTTDAAAAAAPSDEALLLLRFAEAPQTHFHRDRGRIGQKQMPPVRTRSSSASSSSSSEGERDRTPSPAPPAPKEPSPPTQQNSIMKQRARMVLMATKEPSPPKAPAPPAAAQQQTVVMGFKEAKRTPITPAAAPKKAAPAPAKKAASPAPPAPAPPPKKRSRSGEEDHGKSGGAAKKQKQGKEEGSDDRRHGAATTTNTSSSSSAKQRQELHEWALKHGISPEKLKVMEDSLSTAADAPMPYEKRDEEKMDVDEPKEVKKNYKFTQRKPTQYQNILNEATEKQKKRDEEAAKNKSQKTDEEKKKKKREEYEDEKKKEEAKKKEAAKKEAAKKEEEEAKKKAAKKEEEEAKKKAAEKAKKKEAEEAKKKEEEEEEAKNEAAKKKEEDSDDDDDNVEGADSEEEEGEVRTTDNEEEDDGEAKTSDSGCDTSEDEGRKEAAGADADEQQQQDAGAEEEDEEDDVGDWAISQQLLYGSKRAKKYHFFNEGETVTFKVEPHEQEDEASRRIIASAGVESVMLVDRKKGLINVTFARNTTVKKRFWNESGQFECTRQANVVFFKAKKSKKAAATVVFDEFAAIAAMAPLRSNTIPSSSSSTYVTPSVPTIANMFMDCNTSKPTRELVKRTVGAIVKNAQNTAETLERMEPVMEKITDQADKRRMTASCGDVVTRFMGLMMQQIATTTITQARTNFALLSAYAEIKGKGQMWGGELQADDVMGDVAKLMLENSDVSYTLEESLAGDDLRADRLAEDLYVKACAADLTKAEVKGSKKSKNTEKSQDMMLSIVQSLQHLWEVKATRKTYDINSKNSHAYAYILMAQINSDHVMVSLKEPGLATVELSVAARMAASLAVLQYHAQPNTQPLQVMFREGEGGQATFQVLRNYAKAGTPRPAPGASSPLTI